MVCSIEAKLEDFSTMRETLDKQAIAILEKYTAITANQELIYSDLDPSLSPFLAKISLVTLSKSDGCSSTNLLTQQLQLCIGSNLMSQGGIKERNQPYYSQVQLQE